jgi:hypothetical protein
LVFAARNLKFSATRAAVSIMHLSPLDPSKFRAQGAGSRSPMSSPVATKRRHCGWKSVAGTAELSSRDAGVGAANALPGRPAEAQKAMVHLRNIDSVLRVSTSKNGFRFVDQTT